MRSASLAMSTSVLKALPGKLDIKRHSPSIRYISASLAMQQAFSRPCLVNLISKDTHLVFSISRQASRCQQVFSKPRLVNLISKYTHLVFAISLQASRCQQAFSKPCLVNLISKDTHLVFALPFSSLAMSTSVLKALLVNLISKHTHLLFFIPRQVSRCQRKKEDNDQESVQSSSTSEPGYQLESDNVKIRHHKRVPRGLPFPSR